MAKKGELAAANGAECSARNQKRGVGCRQRSGMQRRNQKRGVGCRQRSGMRYERALTPASLVSYKLRDIKQRMGIAIMRACAQAVIDQLGSLHIIEDFVRRQSQDSRSPVVLSIHLAVRI